MKYPTAFRYGCVVPPGSYQLLKTANHLAVSQNFTSDISQCLIKFIPTSHVRCHSMLKHFMHKRSVLVTFKYPTAESYWPFEGRCLHDATLYTSPQCLFMFRNTPTINRAHLSTQHYWSSYLRWSVSSVTHKPALQKSLRHCQPSNNQVNFLLKYRKYLY